jgi:PhnB protein
MKPIIPYLTFYGNAKEAASYYENLFDLTNEGMMKYGDGDFPSPPEAKDLIMHCQLSKGSFNLMLADSQTPGDAGSTNVALMIGCETEEEIHRLYDALLTEGSAVMELQDTFWGAKYAKVKDKYGYTWDLNYQKES